MDVEKIYCQDFMQNILVRGLFVMDLKKIVVEVSYIPYKVHFCSKNSLTVRILKIHQINSVTSFKNSVSQYLDNCLNFAQLIIQFINPRITAKNSTIN